ncbi:MAG: hypothetical protein F4Y30_04980 [Chloroflexi bacterium]|nr:hypothetical protein [Chloroflexota bacterium]MXX51302.1 hypothetical protein [Chloroflexota bacterium]MYA92759.1 hypothetical protein [Chloroflexota bacterium]MYC56960.1 hypothetical protein [Chloroflexota bacterium]MYD38113.1 hypothetical protein [Chloroflexota bacterium]
MAMEYEALRSTQGKIMDGLDQVLPKMITAIEQNRIAIEQNRVAIAEVNHKLDALLKHWDVAYEKPPMGFNPEPR